MNEIPFVIIMPAYNAVEYLERSVQSVVSQNYKSYSLIIVNDGSTDGTGRLADKLAGQNTRIYVVHQDNKGQIVSRSNGIAYAKEHKLDSGGYYLFLDADDEFKTGAFARINGLLTEKHCDMLIFDAEKYNCSADKIVGKLGGEIKGEVSSKPDLFNIVLYDYRYNSLCRKAVSAHIVSYIDFERFSSLRNAEDLIQSMDYYYASDSVLFVDDCLYRYYMNPDSVTHSMNVENYPIDSTARVYTWEFVRRKKIWTSRELDEYAGFLLSLLEKKIASVCFMDGTETQKSAVYDKIKQDPFYRELLSGNYKHSRVISYLISGKYKAMTRAVKLDRVFSKLKSR